MNTEILTQEPESGHANPDHPSGSVVAFEITDIFPTAIVADFDAFLTGVETPDENYWTSNNSLIS